MDDIVNPIFISLKIEVFLFRKSKPICGTAIQVLSTHLRPLLFIFLNRIVIDESSFTAQVHTIFEQSTQMMQAN